MLLQQTLQHLHQLKMIGMADALREQQKQPALQALSFEERLGLLVDIEITDRTNRRVSHLLRLAKLRQQACIEDIDYQHPRGLVKSKFSPLLTCNFISHHQNVLITGPTGCGKSWLACALGHQACRQGIRVRYWRTSRLLEELRISHADGSYSSLLSSLSKIDLLILDDFGLEILQPTDRNDLLEIIEDRHHLKSTLITSQLAVKHWHEHIGEPTLADAILDRLLQHSHKFELSGDSMRKGEKEIKKEKIVD
jgi:DNA replication protein DnaC